MKSCAKHFVVTEVAARNLIICEVMSLGSADSVDEFGKKKKKKSVRVKLCSLPEATVADTSITHLNL